MSLPVPPFDVPPVAAARYLTPPTVAVSLFNRLKSFAGIKLPGTSEVSRSAMQFMAGVQGNILSPHRLPFSELHFFRHVGSRDDMRAYFREAADEVTTALRQRAELSGPV